MGNIIRQPCDEAVILSGRKATPCAKSAEPWVLTATILGSSIAFIDGTVVNVALPALQTSLNATVVDVQWVVEAYALLLAALLLVGGSLGDHFGRKRIYAIGVILFALSSAWCGISSNVAQLIAARAVQGVGGALLVPGSLAIISASFDENRRGQAIGIWSGFTSIAAAIGPVAGGWMIEHISWRAAFFVNLPIAIVVLAIVFWRVPESRDRATHSALDWRGAFLATIGLAALVYGLIESSRLGLRHPVVLSASIAGVILLGAFLVFEMNATDPMLPLGLFHSRDFSGANLLTLLLYAALAGALFFYPLNLIQIQGYSVTAAGASFLPFILIMFLLSRWAGGLVKRYGARIPLTIGPLIAGAGLALLAVPGTHSNYWTDFFPPIVVLGLGMAISVAPLTTTVMNSISQNQAGIASGINNAVSRIAALLAIAIFGIVMMRSFNHQLDRRLAIIEIHQEARTMVDEQRVKLAAIQLPADLSNETRTRIQGAVKDSFVSSFRLVILLASGLAVLSSLSAWFIIGRGFAVATVPKS